MPDEIATVGPGTPVCHLWAAGRQDRAQVATRAISCLFRAGVSTVGELTAMSAGDVLDIRGAGSAVLDEVRRALAARELSLQGDEAGEAAWVHARVRLLRSAGLGPVAALRFARELWPAGEIAPGVTVSVSELPALPALPVEGDAWPSGEIGAGIVVTITEGGSRG